MKHIYRRRKGIAYHYFDGIGIRFTYDTGKTENIERHKMRNYFDKDNARLLEQAVKELFKSVQ